MQQSTFLDTFVNKLDSKGRVSVPSSFRQILASQGADGLYCIRAVGRPALEAFGEHMHAEFLKRVEHIDPVFDPKYDSIASRLFARNRFLPFDEEGRVRIPDKLIEYTRITDRVAFVGLGRKFQIWDFDSYEAAEREEDERALALRNGGLA